MIELTLYFLSLFPSCLQCLFTVENGSPHFPAQQLLHATIVAVSGALSLFLLHLLISVKQLE